MLLRLIRDEIDFRHRKRFRKEEKDHDRQEELKETAARYPEYRESVLRGHLTYIGYCLIDEMSEKELDAALSGVEDLIGQERFQEELTAWKRYSIRTMHRHFLSMRFDTGYMKKVLKIYEQAAGEEKAKSNMLYCGIEIQLNGINWDSLFWMDYHWKD